MDGFVFKRPRKTLHVEKVKLLGHFVDCPCGSRWFAAVEALNADGGKRSLPADPTTQTCPDCGTRPVPGRIGTLEEVEHEVPLTFGGPLAHGRVRLR